VTGWNYERPWNFVLERLIGSVRSSRVWMVRKRSRACLLQVVGELDERKEVAQQMTECCYLCWLRETAVGRG
jgi:hypothetical protein